MKWIKLEGGFFRNVLVSLLNASRPNDNMVDRTQAKQDAEALLASCKKWSAQKVGFQFYASYSIY